MKTLINLKDISKTYILGGQQLNVLKSINLEIKQGDFVSIMGQSGSGKSTLMNIIGMLDIPTSGKYIFDEKDVSNLSDDDQSLIRRENIGFIFQTYNLIPRLPVINQVMLPLMYQGVPSKQRKERAFQALKKVGLHDKLYNLPTELSGGQQQRVSIARALVTNPKMILGDEPTGALDSKTSKEVMEFITNLYNEGKTIVLITHDSEIDSFAKTHINIKDGIII